MFIKCIRLAGFICLGLIIAGLIEFGTGYYFGCQRISLSAGIKVIAYPISSTPQPSSLKQQKVSRGGKKAGQLFKK